MRLGLPGSAHQAEELSCVLRTLGDRWEEKDARRKVNWRGQEVPEPREDRVGMGERSGIRLKRCSLTCGWEHPQGGRGGDLQRLDLKGLGCGGWFF